MMIAVIFEVELDPASRQEYLAIAADLRAQLQAIDGFVSVERYASLTRPDTILSLSLWRDEEAVQRWRTLEAHRMAQARGRAGLFRNYRLRVAQVVRDYGLHDRGEVPVG
jgi:heme-degrading monooxygenase HmoA